MLLYFQEQLKDTDSYVYLAAINGIASLAMHCTEDVLAVLCREFLNISMQSADIETKEIENRIHELRMKIGDIIVKVTKRLGESFVFFFLLKYFWVTIIRPIRGAENFWSLMSYNIKYYCNLQVIYVLFIKHYY